ncbi:helix-turn-helix transcriptional regulator [Bradyrhizobium sp. 138]|uniref:helix-turn-helix domain-containing protein n=1 Tax=Bradyrhizobium sp. 138 TaxID=2782615 RepID=UPI001FF98C7E|nr:AraC family transcriptional regulator [Bradyrhizobium sp. 138]MCK1737851.1 helix-turn-helix transcriptional regulator [Bradyrhizobium sp. 138]
MTQAGAYGEKLGQFLRLKEAPPALVTRSLRSAELAVTETRNDRPLMGLSGSLTAEDAFLVSLKLRDYPDCELWERGKSIMKADVRAGTTYLYDLKLDPRYVIDKPFHSLFFYLPRSALDGVAEQSGAKRVDQLDCQIGVGHDDEIIRHIGAALQHGLRRPHEANQLFIDHMMLALTVHVVRTYGGLQALAGPTRGGLAPWQVKRACERLESDLGGKLSLQTIASELDLSVSHFSRAFRSAVGMPPHQWLLHQRVNAAKQLMSVRGLPLSEIAISAGFANQSHFTRVFSSIVGVSPAVWRRQTSGVSGTDA